MDIVDMQKMLEDKNFEEFKKRLLNLNSTFRFKCRKCGKCCQHQDTIILTPRDVFRIARKQNRSMLDVINDYAEVYIGENSLLPVVHLLPKGPKEQCPLLTKDGLCSVHDCKPTVCALYPLGRVSAPEDLSKLPSAENKRTVWYILNKCGNSSKKEYTVREWLQKNNVPENDWFFLQWAELIMELSQTLREVYGCNPDDPGLQYFIETAVFPCLYLNYDITQDFRPQFERIKEIIEAGNKIIKGCEDKKKKKK